MNPSIEQKASLPAQTAGLLHFCLVAVASSVYLKWEGQFILLPILSVKQPKFLALPWPSVDSGSNPVYDYALKTELTAVCLWKVQNDFCPAFIDMQSTWFTFTNHKLIQLASSHERAFWVTIWASLKFTNWQDTAESLFSSPRELLANICQGLWVLFIL